ncbi:MAG: 16S rRNA (cytidine(1402)-2'-O)-methyltransferase [Melioribacteraceae bacterium]|nr:MAG: 16S rRNA (cytidine(1402)-2'-O)-methyltransferase [Melioribacteraceae bacterium]
MNNKLFLVSTPIGNYDDITLRALQVLKSVDFIICEEYKQARRLLSHYEIEKELVALNEHNEKETAQEVAQKILEGKSAALISDCGTPLFSDPGHLLVDYCISFKIQIVPVPGANSLIPALIGSGLDFEKFYYYGWLSPKKEERKKELFDLKKIKGVTVVMETPYRAKALLADISKIFGPNQQIVLAYKLTMPEEKYYRGTVSQVLNIFEKENLKGEFVLVINNK